MLNYLKANHVELYNSIRVKIEEFLKQPDAKGPDSPIKIVQLLKAHLPSKIFEAGHKTFQRIIRETEWKSKGFTRNPAEEVDVQVNVSHCEYARLFNKEIPLIGLDLGAEQLKLLTSVGSAGGTGSLVSPGSSGLLQQQNQSQVIKEQYKDWSKRNVLTARSSYARLRVSRADATDKVVVDFAGKAGEPRTAAVTGSQVNEWKSPAQVETSDAACTMLSMATQQFIERVLTASISNAQKDVGIDGIRIHAMQVSGGSYVMYYSSILTHPPPHPTPSCPIRRNLPRANPPSE
jgi:hypothetical protein